MKANRKGRGITARMFQGKRGKAGRKEMRLCKTKSHVEKKREDKSRNPLLGKDFKIIQQGVGPKRLPYRKAEKNHFNSRD